jgi:hypothetical protein
MRRLQRRYGMPTAAVRSWPPATARWLVRFIRVPRLPSLPEPWPPEAFVWNPPPWWPAVWRGWARRRTARAFPEADVALRGERRLWALEIEFTPKIDRA